MKTIKLSTIVMMLTAAFFFTSCNQTSEVEEVTEEVVEEVTTGATGYFVADLTISEVNWLGKKVTGEHSGTIALADASFNLENGTLVKGQAVVDMSSIVVTDIEDAKMNSDLKGHLESEDFFNVAEFPNAYLKFAATDVEAVFEGTLEIKGITMPVYLDAEVSGSEANPVVTGKVVIDRTEYDIKYGSGKFFENLGDKTINDEFELTFSIVAE